VAMLVEAASQLLALSPDFYSTKDAKEFIFHVYIHSDPFYNYASDQCYVK